MTIFEVARIAISVPFWLLFGTKWRFKYACTAQNAPSRLPKDLVDRFLVSYLKSMCSRAQRVNYAHFFRGRTYHFSTVFGEYAGLNSSSRISVHRNGVQ